MGTKNNPGAFDCYAKAAPDEPMFILLGRDRHAALLVQLWAWLRLADGEDQARVAEALQCAEAMAAFARGRGKWPATMVDLFAQLDDGWPTRRLVNALDSLPLAHGKTPREQGGSSI